MVTAPGGDDGLFEEGGPYSDDSPDMAILQGFLLPEAATASRETLVRSYRQALRGGLTRSAAIEQAWAALRVSPALIKDGLVTRAEQDRPDPVVERRRGAIAAIRAATGLSVDLTPPEPEEDPIMARTSRADDIAFREERGLPAKPNPRRRSQTPEGRRERHLRAIARRENISLADAARKAPKRTLGQRVASAITGKP